MTVRTKARKPVKTEPFEGWSEIDAAGNFRMMSDGTPFVYAAESATKPNELGHDSVRVLITVLPTKRRKKS